MDKRCRRDRAFSLYYFFFPHTHTHPCQREDLVVAPCDGTVVVIEEVEADEYLKTAACSYPSL
jgi:hypothetical protein